MANGSLDDFPRELAKVVEVAWYNFIWGAGCYPYESEIPTQQVAVNVTGLLGRGWRIGSDNWNRQTPGDTSRRRRRADL